MFKLIYFNDYFGQVACLLFSSTEMNSAILVNQKGRKFVSTEYSAFGALYGNSISEKEVFKKLTDFLDLNHFYLTKK